MSSDMVGGFVLGKFPLVSSISVHFKLNRAGGEATSPYKKSPIQYDDNVASVPLKPIRGLLASQQERPRSCGLLIKYRIVLGKVLFFASCIARLRDH